MLEKNLERLEEIPKVFKEIIEEEVGEEYKQNRDRLHKICGLETENEKLKQKIEKLKVREKTNSKSINSFMKAFEKLVEEGILEYSEDGDSGYDEYGNGGGYHHFEYRYKGEVVFEDGESF